MKLYFLRHGLAGDREDWQGDDRERPLTEEGIQRMRREGTTLSKLGLEPDHILTSPLVRARQTADLAAEALGLGDKVVEDNRLEPGFSNKNLEKILEDYSEAGSLMLVGHEPDFSETIGAIIGGEVEVKKGALARVDLDEIHPPHGSLVWLLPPKALDLSGGGEE